jgi:hypothetical protein
MPELILTLPGYYIEVVSRLKKCAWLIHNFRNGSLDDIYNPAIYLYRQEIEGTGYIASIDLNVMQYVVNCVKKKVANEHYQNACAMLLFCRFANIQIESGLAMYERINHGTGDIEEALDELAVLRALDNADPDLLAEYMLGNHLSLRGLEVPGIDRATLRDGLTRYRRLIDWDSIYVLILGAVSVYLDDSLAAKHKFDRYLDWMITDFRLSLPILVYAVRLFGKISLRGMMKFKLSQSTPERKRALVNMTWDLFLVDRYLKNWVDPKKKREEILFSQDIVVKELLRTAISVQYAEGIDPFFNYLRESQYLRCKELLNSASFREDRVYLGKAWNPEYRADLIRKLEHELGALT